MNNTHDNLKIMTTKEILERNVYDLQEQLNNAHKKIVKLQEEIDKLEDFIYSVFEINKGSHKQNVSI